MKLKQIITNYFGRADKFRRSLAEKKRLLSPAYNPLAFPDTLVECLDDPIITLIGESYKRAYPNELPLNWRDVAGNRGDSNINSLSVKQRRQLLTQRIKEDFVNGSVVELQGWLLSKTEARQCALFGQRRSD